MSSELATLVPVEIWEHIIDFVNTISTRRFDPVRCRTLASCCLTSRSWLPRSRLHLYHSVSLYLTPQYQNHSSFLRGLSLNPTNGPLVQWLMVKTEDPNVLESSAGSGLSLIALQLPHRLPNLQFLTLAGVDLINIHPTTYIGLSCFRSVRFLVLQASVWSRYDQIYRVIKAFSGLIEVIIDFPPSHIVQSPTPFVEWTPERRWHNRKITVPSLTLQIPDKYIAGMMHLFAPCTVLNIELRNLLPPEMLAVANYLRLCGKALRKLTLNFKSKAGPVAMHTMVHNVPSEFTVVSVNYQC
ncbi:hypothetical protein BXZ70DRAFT_952099 [Cristinia sonorae]|uniref:F-box domain-containing protein n=1 Tax=Cristinia sonorae TaxID=1940300 RepID=A0A8K0UJN3_9AGAR|nr:hypothetical protein BXZ70DRAFT_952099 [Cristinia sonorae]